MNEIGLNEIKSRFYATASLTTLHTTVNKFEYSILLQHGGGTVNDNDK